MRHERLLVAGGVALLVLLSWWYVVGRAGVDTGMAGMGSPPFAALVVMWSLMMLAMMLPSVAPAVLLYARVREIRSRDADIAQTWVFLSGYATVWLLFSIVAAAAQQLLTGPSMALDNRLADGVMLLVAGLYQVSPLKSACVRQCRSPAQFISRHWQPGWDGAIWLGMRHGAYCVGCCWLLMALLFVGGIMNLLWIAGLTLLVAIEKLAPRGALFGRAVGLGLIVWGLAKVAGY
jgi:predicted metal-binding membrane protein